MADSEGDIFAAASAIIDDPAALITTNAACLAQLAASVRAAQKLLSEFEADPDLTQVIELGRAGFAQMAKGFDVEAGGWSAPASEPPAMSEPLPGGWHWCLDSPGIWHPRYGRFWAPPDDPVGWGKWYEPYYEYLKSGSMPGS